ncbi:MAG: ComEA family DNA-binding protein [Prochloraceae cyanobacterium]|nr:ComEA family DNA-binding protein [Prochloraceae cyanobacterium]
MNKYNWFASQIIGNAKKKLSPDRAIIRAKIINDPYYRFQSLAEIDVAAELGIQIDVNRASVDDWLRLPGFSIHQARSLVDLTNTGIQFLCLEDLASAIGISIARLKPLEPVLAFSYYDPQSALNPPRLNPNLATVEQLAEIPFLEETVAIEIVENRDRNGTYRNLADLQRRLALKSELVAQLMQYLQF